MIAAFSAFVIGGMPAGLAAFLQADAKGWRVIIGVALALLAAVALLSWAAFAVEDWTAKAVAELDGDPRVIAGGVLGGFTVWALVGAVIDKFLGRRVPPVSLGLRTAIGVSFLQFGLNVSGLFE